MKEALLTTLRDRFTTQENFRIAADRLSCLIASTSGSFLNYDEKNVETPLTTTSGKYLSQYPILVPILRAGLVFLPPFLSLYPKSKVGLLGIRRNEKTIQPELYYSNLPSIDKDAPIFLLDPMLATGQSAAMAVKILKEKGAEESQIVLFSLLAAPEGVQFLDSHCPEIRKMILQIDHKLTSSAWISPGLGDFGDRYFGT